MDESVELRTLVDEVDALFARGDLDRAAQQRQRLRELAQAQAHVADRELLWRARVLASHLSLARLEVDAAAAVLGIEWSGAHGPVVHVEPEAVGGSSVLAALANAEIANLLFRRNAIAAGAALAAHALAMLRRRDGKHHGFRLITARMLALCARVWRARLAWQTGKRDEGRSVLNDGKQEAEAFLRSFATETAIADANNDSSEPEATSGIVVALALILNLDAEWEASIGRTEDAATLARRGILLLQDGSASDTPRLAHLLYVLGKIEARQGERDGYQLAIQVLRHSRKLYDTHPFIFRAWNQEAQCWVRAGRTDLAETVLDRAEAELANASHLSAYEEKYAAASFRMTRLWIAGRKARLSRGEEAQQLWKDCKRDADEMIEHSQHLSYRLLADAHLQRGVACSHLGERDNAIAALTTASELAVAKDLVTIQLASGFRLAEALHQDKRTAEASRVFQRACVLMEERDVRSAYLSQRRKETAALLSNGVSLHIPHRVAYEEAERMLRRAYFEYYLAHARSMAELAELTDVPRPTLARWLEELGMAHEPAERGLLGKRGRPRKRPTNT